MDTLVFEKSQYVHVPQNRNNGDGSRNHTKCSTLDMVSKTFQWFGQFARRRQVVIITTSATLAAGLVLYEKLREKVAHADSRYSSPSNFCDTPFKERGAGDSVINLYNTSEYISSDVKWDDNWDRQVGSTSMLPPKNSIVENV